jgi:trigger factor
LKVTTERQENCVVQLDIIVEPEEERSYLRRSARALSREYRIRGFRPGKAPYDVVVQRLGIDMVRAQAVDQFGDHIFSDGLDLSELEPVAQASLEEVTWDPFTLHLTVPVGPEVTLGDYRDIRIPWGVPEVTEDQVNAELIELQEDQSEWRPDDRPAEFGDQVVLNIKGTVEGESVLENTDRELVLDADSPYPVPGFADAVVGMQPDETREFDLSYPDDHYNAEIAGKTGHFVVTLTEIRVEVLPELDDEFAMMVGDYENLEELKASVRSSLEEQAQERAEDEYEEQIWEEILETASVEYPLVMVESELESIKRQMENTLQQQSLDLESYFRLTGTTEEAWLEEAQPQAAQRVVRGLVLSEVVSAEELTLLPGEMSDEVERIVASAGDQGERVREMLESPQGLMSVSEQLLTGKAIERLKAIARGEDPPIGEPETEATDSETAEDADAADETTAESDAAAAETNQEETAAAEAPADEEISDEADSEEETADAEAADQEATQAETAAQEAAEDESADGDDEDD